ncbi:hypothetical protein [Aestuariibacter sp. A3R04]|uniref:hypothetical protein n=1 Tax=Aestuariibacter sp. A3R04 TaxID=2841571 RepID=UPI001C084CE8|nr:hypothetical protein [Aestuariibacter sp. A3R04]MBU3023317.1 hypothetical protein [Aestuariibacter sp. A3R04]
MNRKPAQADSQYVNQIKQLIDLVEPAESGMTSVIMYAKRYFTLTPPMKSHATELAAELRQMVKEKADDKDILAIRKKYDDIIERLHNEHFERQKIIRDIVGRLVLLCEGDTWEETQQNSAKFLGCIVMMTRGNGGTYQKLHQRLKPLYKAVLALRLTDKLLTDGTVSHSYLGEFSHLADRYDSDARKQEWLEHIACPVIVAAVLQDIGLHHPDAIIILNGDNKRKDPFRMLDETDRKALLKTNYQATLTFAKNGISLASLDEDVVDEGMVKKAEAFLLEMLQDTFTGKSGIGDIIKIPQVYASIVLSTKPGYSRLDLPKGYIIIEQMAKRGNVNSRLAEHFISLVGYFPQGFGVCFIPVNEKGVEKDQYEYAIVSQLNPAKPVSPVCRIVTRNLTYITNGKDETIPKERNLFFTAAKQKLMRIDRSRLIEIMGQMTNNFNEDDLDKVIPAFWEPSDFFSDKRHQSAWKK